MGKTRISQKIGNPCMNEAELWDWMMEGKSKSEDRRATAILTREITVRKWQGHFDPEKVETWPAGKKVKVVMASRFGDVGITDDLDAIFGYCYRTTCLDTDMGKATGLLPDIQKV